MWRTDFDSFSKVCIRHIGAVRIHEETNLIRTRLVLKLQTVHLVLNIATKSLQMRRSTSQGIYCSRGHMDRRIPFTCGHVIKAS